MCSGPVSTITECGPMTDATGELAAADGATSAGAVNTAFTASGSLTSTSFSPLGAKVMVKVPPSRSAQLSIIQVGASAQASVCTNAGARGPRGKRRGDASCERAFVPTLSAGDRAGAWEVGAVRSYTLP